MSLIAASLDAFATPRHGHHRRADQGLQLELMSDMLDTRGSWLSEDDLSLARVRLPMVYVDALPVRVNALGEITAIGLLLRGRHDGSLSRAVVSGRVLYGELLRHALLRHIEKDLGTMALPRIPSSIVPFTVAEYFPDPEVTGFVDPRQHAVSLCYIVACDGDCVPSQDALDLAWVTPQEALSYTFQAEMTGGQGRLVRLALAHCGYLD